MGSTQNKRLRRKNKSALDEGPRRGRNALRPARERRRKQHEAQVEALYRLEEPNAWLLPAGKIVRVLGLIFLFPLCVVTTIAFLSCFASSLEAAFWRTAPFWFFAMGIIMWLVCFFWIARPIYLYVWGHEATHAAFTILCFGKVHEFNVTAAGGHVVTDKNNLLISLSPYFVPFYAVVAALLFWLVGLKWDLSAWHRVGLSFFGGFRWEWLGYWLLGVTWGFHLSFTVWMIAKDQPDLSSNGTVFSLHVIYLANILLLSVLLVIAEPMLTWRGFWQEWRTAAEDCLRGMARSMLWVERQVRGL